MEVDSILSLLWCITVKITFTTLAQTALRWVEVVSTIRYLFLINIALICPMTCKLIMLQFKTASRKMEQQREEV